MFYLVVFRFSLVFGLSSLCQVLQPPAPSAARSGGEVASPRSQGQAVHPPPVGYQVSDM